MQGDNRMAKGSPVVTTMQVIPVAGRDSMLMTLSGAHGPFFTRNLVILTDSAGHRGIGEIHGGDYTCRALERFIPLVEGEPVGAYRRILGKIHGACGHAAREGGRGDPAAGHRKAEIRGSGGVGRGVRPLGPAWAVSGASGLPAVGRGKAAGPGGNPGLPVLRQRQGKDGPALFG